MKKVLIFGLLILASKNYGRNRQILVTAKS